MDDQADSHPSSLAQVELQSGYPESVDSNAPSSLTQEHSAIPAAIGSADQANDDTNPQTNNENPTADARRVALIFSDDKVDSSNSENYITFLSECGFRVNRCRFPDSTGELHEVLPSANSSTVKQVVVAVLCHGSCKILLKDFLKFMKDRFTEQVDQFLLFCRIQIHDKNSAPEETDQLLTQEKTLVTKFSQNAFKFDNIIIAYHLNTAENIESFFKKFQEKQEAMWMTDCIYDILRDLVGCPKLTTHPQKHRRKFLRKVVLLPSGLLSTDAKQTDIRIDHSLAPFSSIIYDNRRIKDVLTNKTKAKLIVNNPRALVIVNIKRQIRESINADWQNLERIFTTLKYDVRGIQAANSEKEIEDWVCDFVNDKYHGDSCVLIVLSDPELSGACVNKMHDLMANGTALSGKPRLVVIQEWRSSETTDGEGCDGFAGKLTLGLSGVAEKLREKLKERPITEPHPHSGMLFCHSTTDSSEKNGSPFITAMCETFSSHGSKEDLVSMIPFINDRMEDTGTVPQWWVQTTKLFFITDTTDASEAMKESAGQTCDGRTDTSGESETPDVTETGGGNKDGPIGNAVILTEGHFDEACNYQTFLEFVGFNVFANSGSTVSEEHVESMIESRISTTGLAVVLIVRSFCGDNAYRDILKAFAKIERQKSSLLIFLEVTNDCCAQIMENLDEKDLPAKCSVVYHSGTKEHVVNFLKMLLDDTVDNLCACPVVGFDFSNADKVQKKQQELGFEFEYRSNDPNHEWSKLTWLINYLDDFKDSAIETFIKMRDTVGLKPTGFKHAIQRNSKKAHIIHNVIFDIKKHNRFGSLFDRQQLTKSLTKLGYSVTTSSNLTAAKLLEDVKIFANSSDHGDSCVLVVMSHGEMGQIFGTYMKSVSEADILRAMNCSNLAGKQKLIVFQACRDYKKGHAEREAINVNNYPDMIVAHSTSAGDQSYRRNLFGSRFIQSMCLVLDMCAEQLDAVTLISGVNYLTTHCFGDRNLQLPCWIINTKKRCYLGNQRPKESVEHAAANADGSQQLGFEKDLENLPLENQVEGQFSTSVVGVQTEE